MGSRRVSPFCRGVGGHSDDEWDRMGWVMVQGCGGYREWGEEHVRAQASLRAGYSQLEAMGIEGLPVVAIRIEHAASWGSLRTGEEA